jgi:hypothetical protein
LTVRAALGDEPEACVPGVVADGPGPVVPVEAGVEDVLHAAMSAIVARAAIARSLHMEVAPFLAMTSTCIHLA